MTKQIYKDFLEHCRVHGITVDAHKDVPNNGRSHPPHPQIAVNRVSSKRCIIGQLSDNKDLDDFINGSLDVPRELSILLHEYGHYSCNHPDIDMTSQEGMEKGYEEEKEAWTVGHELLKKLGASKSQLSEFEVEAEKALKTYRQDMLGIK